MVMEVWQHRGLEVGQGAEAGTGVTGLYQVMWRWLAASLLQIL